MYGEKNKCTAAFTGIWLQKKQRTKKCAISKNRLRVHCTLIVHLQDQKKVPYRRTGCAYIAP